MTNNTSTFTPSTQILEAGEKAQALADAGNALKPFFSPEIQETVDGVDKIANAMNATGEAMRHFGFDEAEPDSITGAGQTMGPAFFTPSMMEYRTVTPEDPDYQFIAQAPQINELEPSWIESLISSINQSSFSTLPMVIGPEEPEYQYIGGTVMGVFGLDVDEAEPYIPEVGVDALA